MQHAGRWTLQGSKSAPMPSRFDNCESRKRHADIRIAHNTVVKMLIKTWENNIVLMQDMYPFPAGSLNAPVPNARQTIVLRFLMNCHPIAGDLANQLDRRAVGRTIIHQLNLHPPRPW